METTSLLFEKLALEIVDHIYSFLDPSSHFALASTCKLIYAQSQHILHRHRVAYREFHVASDLSPQLVVKLLRSAFSPSAIERIDAWHVRELEIWGTRKSWADWVRWNVTERGEIVQGALEESPLSFSNCKMIAKSLLTELEPFMHPESDDLARAHRLIEVGEDGVIKMLLVSILPRLNVLKFVRRVDDRHSSLQWLSKFVLWIMKTQSPWPPGFLSLRNVAVGIPILDDGLHGAGERAQDLATLLRLPHIDQLYFGDLNTDLTAEELGQEYGDDNMSEEEIASIILPPGSSSVRRIILDNIQSFGFDLRESVCKAARNLEGFIIGGPHAQEEGEYLDTDAYVTHLQDSQSCTSLRQFFLYRPDYLTGYHCDIYDTVLLEYFTNLQVANVAVLDMTRGALEKLRTREVQTENDEERNSKADEDEKGKEDSDHKSKTDDDDLVSRDNVIDEFVNHLPASLTTLLVWINTEPDYIFFDPQEIHEVVDDAIMAMIESGRFKGLKAVYVDQMEKKFNQPRTKFCFQKAVSAGRKHKVYVKTVWNRDQPEDESDFLPLLDKYDIKSGPFTERDSTWVINPFTGAWTAPGCRACGHCETCLQYYTTEAWAGLSSDFVRR